MLDHKRSDAFAASARRPGLASTVSCLDTRTTHPKRRAQYCRPLLYFFANQLLQAVRSQRSGMHWLDFAFREDVPAYAKGTALKTLPSCVALHSIFSNRIKRPNSASRTRDSRPLGITIISLCSFLTYSESSRLPWKGELVSGTGPQAEVYNGSNYRITSVDDPAVGCAVVFVNSTHPVIRASDWGSQ